MHTRTYTLLAACALYVCTLYGRSRSCQSVVDETRICFETDLRIAHLYTHTIYTYIKQIWWIYWRLGFVLHRSMRCIEVISLYFVNSLCPCCLFVVVTELVFAFVFVYVSIWFLFLYNERSCYFSPLLTRISSIATLLKRCVRSPYTQAPKCKITPEQIIHLFACWMCTTEVDWAWIKFHTVWFFGTLIRTYHSTFILFPSSCFPNNFRKHNTTITQFFNIFCLHSKMPSTEKYSHKFWAAYSGTMYQWRVFTTHSSSIAKRRNER